MRRLFPVEATEVDLLPGAVSFQSFLERVMPEQLQDKSEGRENEKIEQEDNYLRVDARQGSREAFPGVPYFSEKLFHEVKLTLYGLSIKRLGKVLYFRCKIGLIVISVDDHC
jgi:hypothetical protein